MVQGRKSTSTKVCTSHHSAIIVNVLRARLLRYVWEIVLGAHEHFIKEESLVTLNIEDGMTCDVIGDVHGE